MISSTTGPWRSRCSIPDLAATLAPERFLREIRLAARLQHPHILTVLDSGDASGRLWFTMPYVEGESLRDRLLREKQLPVADAVRIATEAALALDYAHRHGVIHRDIKPENILLSDGQALVADFGIAQTLASNQEQLTQTGTTVGTPAYMSPEQAAGQHQLDAKTDIYSLATVLYEMLSGELPFTGPTLQAITAKRLTGEPAHVRQARPAVPEAVDQAIRQALSLVPADRFSSAAEFARAVALSNSVEMAKRRSPAGTSGSLGFAAAPVPARHRLRVPQAAIALALAFLVGLSVLFAWRQGRTRNRAAEGEPKRLAVLPFESAGDTSDRAFADGMTEELTTRLARVPGLRLLARSSTLQYRRTGQAAPAFGRELGVDYVLDGTVRTTVGPEGQKRVRITPELIRVDDGTHVWGEPYEGVMSDVFRLQADVARQVAEALRGSLGSEEQAAVRRAPTDDLEAYRLYVLGRADWNRRSPEALENAVNRFHEALARDSLFARAWAGLADAYVLYPVWGVQTPPRDTAYAWAKAAALRAIALDSTLPEPHASLNQILRYAYWDWSGSEREIRRAIALDPNYATAHQWLAEHLLDMGRIPEAIAEARLAVQLDPLAQMTQNALGMALWFAGQTDEAETVFRAAVARDSSLDMVARTLVLFYVTTGRTGTASALLGARRDTSSLLNAVVRAQSSPAARTSALAVLGRLRAQRLTGRPFISVARYYAFLGEREAALAMLEQAVAERNPGLEMIKVEPFWDSVRQHPRFQAVLRQIGVSS